MRKLRSYSPHTARVVKLADTPDLGSGALWRKGSSPFSRISIKMCPWGAGTTTSGSSSAVELHLAKVDVAGSIPVSRSTERRFWVFP